MTGLNDWVGLACRTERKDQRAQRTGRVKGHVTQTDGGALPVGYLGRTMGQAVTHAKPCVVGEGCRQSFEARRQRRRQGFITGSQN